MIKKTTIIGIILLCGWFFDKEIHILTSNIVNNPKFIDVIVTIIGSYLIVLTRKNK